jgi:GH15 family glucan-1,4-alpha-glucosidase
LLVSVLDRLAATWRDPDCGFWEIRGRARHYTHSKLSAQIAFDRALRLARKGELPIDDAPAWARELEEIQSFVESRCWSDALAAYRFYADEDKLDTTTLLAYRRRMPQRATSGSSRRSPRCGASSVPADRLCTGTARRWGAPSSPRW